MTTNNNEINILQLRASGSMLGAENVIIEIAGNSETFNIKSVIGIPVLKDDDIPEFARQATQNGLNVKIFNHSSRLSFSLAKDIRKFVYENNIDIIHCHGYQEDFHAWLAKTGKPLIATNHLWKRTDLKLKLYAKLDAFILKRFNHTVAVSDPIYKELQEVGLSPSKISMISNGVDLSRFDSNLSESEQLELKQELGVPTDHMVIGMVSSLTEEKGHFFALRAIADLLKQSNEPVTLLIVGNGDYKKSIMDFVSESKLDSHVIFTGARQDVPELLSIMDIYLLSSLIEGLPMSLLEAMASGLPVISSDVGDIGTVILDGVNGYLTKPKDTKALTEKIIKLVSSNELRETFSTKARQTIENNYSSTSMTDSYCKLYRQLFNQ